jgi:hypothetical protein
MAWLEGLRASGAALPGRSVGTAYRLLILALVMLGLVIGWGAAAALFHYDGTRPVNVVNVLAVFVAAQVCLLLLLGIVMVPDRWVQAFPGVPAFQEALALLSPGQLIRVAIRCLPRTARDLLAPTFASGASDGSLFGRVWKWAVILAAQSFAAAFNAGALAACLYLVTFSDLAFSWSTTLKPDVDTAHRLTQVLSAPWSHWVPEATPSRDLIRETLFYRQAGTRGGGDPARWGQWWPFLAACLITYGLLPRVFLLGLAGWRFRRSTRQALLQIPGVAVVLDRLTSELVTTQATDLEAEAAASSDSATATTGQSRLPDALPLCLVNWGGLAVPDERLKRQVSESWRRRIIHVQHAGGRASLESDASAIAAIAAASGQPGVAVLVKSWEPPVLEVGDFLRDLREAIGGRRLIILTPVSLDAAGRLAPPRESDAIQWQQRLRGLGDAALVVRPWQEGGTP